MDRKDSKDFARHLAKNGQLLYSSLITEPAKIAEMILISSQRFGGEDDYRSSRLKEGRFCAGKTGVIRAERVDMLWRWEVY